MCTYSQLKKYKNVLCNPPPPKGSMAPLMSQNCTSLAKKISQNVFFKVEACN